MFSSLGTVAWESFFGFRDCLEKISGRFEWIQACSLEFPKTTPGVELARPFGDAFGAD